jgi:CHAD domain-containing protein
MNTPTRFRLPDEFNQAQIDTILAERYTFVAEPPHTQSWRVYDTFDWRLFAKSLTLQWSGQDLTLRTIPGGDVLHDVLLSSPPRFAADLPEGALMAQLAPIIKMRALLELATVHTSSCTYRILNKDEKTVVHLIYTEAQLDVDGEEVPCATYLTVRPLRGYAKQANRLAAYLQRSLDISPTNEDINLCALHTAGQSPGAYSGKLDVQLEPDMKAGKATRLILRQLLKTMQTNETGIKADIDIEFLHDYRIAVRRTRSALSQIPKVFSPEPTAHFKREFRTLGRLTNDLRDLDVYLLAEADYRATLPKAMQEDITPLFEYLRSRRSKALAEVIAGLETDAHARLITEWDAFLHEPVRKKDARNASVPIVNLARKRIERQYRSIVRDGTYILEHTEDELLHALRIECKKLRYLLEFFASLFPPKEMRRLIRQLKRLQDNLGEFTDLSVQQAYLLSIAETIEIDETRARRALVATGFLVETMAHKQQDVKADFANTFTDFASPAHQKQFKQLFGTGKGGKS